MIVELKSLFPMQEDIPEIRPAKMRWTVPGVWPFQKEKSFCVSCREAEGYGYAEDQSWPAVERLSWHPEFFDQEHIPRFSEMFLRSPGNMNQSVTSEKFITGEESSDEYRFNSSGDEAVSFLRSVSVRGKNSEKYPETVFAKLSGDGGVADVVSITEPLYRKFSTFNEDISEKKHLKEKILNRLIFSDSGPEKDGYHDLVSYDDIPQRSGAYNLMETTDLSREEEINRENIAELLSRLENAVAQNNSLAVEIIELLGEQEPAAEFTYN